MKNLNPVAGYKQSITGHFYVMRKTILDLVREMKLTPSEVGYFMMFVVCADWDRDHNRYGFIRLESKELASVLGKPEKTIKLNIKKLIAKGLIEEIDGYPKIVGFEKFTYTSAVHGSKEKFTDVEVAEYFGIKGVHESVTTVTKYQKCDKKEEVFEASRGLAFRDSNKDKNKDGNGRTKEEYEEMYRKNPGGLSLDDMEWIETGKNTYFQAKEVFLGGENEKVNS